MFLRYSCVHEDYIPRTCWPYIYFTVIHQNTLVSIRAKWESGLVLSARAHVALEHFLTLASVLIIVSSPSQYYCCDGEKVHVVNDFCACCFAHSPESPFNTVLWNQSLHAHSKWKLGLCQWIQSQCQLLGFKNSSVKGSLV